MIWGPNESSLLIPSCLLSLGQKLQLHLRQEDSFTLGREAPRGECSETRQQWKTSNILRNRMQNQS